MPDATTFVVTAYRKLARGEAGLTQIGTRRVTAAQALDFVLAQFPDGVTIESLDAAGNPLPPGGESDVVRLTIDWLKVPAGIREPQLPARRR